MQLLDTILCVLFSLLCVLNELFKLIQDMVFQVLYVRKTVTEEKKVLLILFVCFIKVFHVETSL